MLETVNGRMDPCGPKCGTPIRDQTESLWSISAAAASRAGFPAGSSSLLAARALLFRAPGLRLSHCFQGFRKHSGSDVVSGCVSRWRSFYQRRLSSSNVWKLHVTGQNGGDGDVQTMCLSPNHNVFHPTCHRVDVLPRQRAKWRPFRWFYSFKDNDDCFLTK